MKEKNSYKRLTFIARSDFTKDLRVISDLDKSIVQEVKDAIEMLIDPKQVELFDKTYKVHRLHGFYAGNLEFHLRDTPKGFKPTEKNDVVVIFKRNLTSLVAVGIRIGSHNRLFHDEFKLKSKKRN